MSLSNATLVWTRLNIIIYYAVGSLIGCKVTELDVNQYTAYTVHPVTTYSSGSHKRRRRDYFESYYLFPDGLISLALGAGLIRRQNEACATHHCLRTCGVCLHGCHDESPLKLNYDSYSGRKALSRRMAAQDAVIFSPPTQPGYQFQIQSDIIIRIINTDNK